MRIRVVLVLTVFAVAALPAATGSAAVTCLGMAATKVGTAGPDTMNGTSGNDVIVGGGGNDTINGFAGDDRICGNAGNDIIQAGPGNDQVQGGPGNDIINGGLGDDILKGGTGNDTIKGGEGNDSLFGEAGDDTLNGEAGTDTVTGGLGTDTCYGETKQTCEPLTPPPPPPPPPPEHWFRVTYGGHSYLCYDDPWNWTQQYDCVLDYGGDPPVWIIDPDLYCSGPTYYLRCDERWYPDELDAYTLISWDYSDYICERAYGLYAEYGDYNCDRYSGGRPPYISSSYPDLMCTEEWSSFDCNTEYYPSEMDGCFFARISYADHVCEDTWQGSECYRYYGGHPKAAMVGLPDYYCNPGGDCSPYGYP